MKKTAIFLFVLLLLFSLCVEKDATSERASQTPTTTSLSPSDIPLSDLQIEACKSANEGGTCQTKLTEVDIVSPQECCKYLNKCC